MGILKDLNELQSEGIVSDETANRIRYFYDGKKSSASGRLFLVFGILGAILVGSGIILILAHNWDDLSRLVKTAFAFLPLLVGQVLCGFSILRRSDSQAWRESSSAFLFFAVGSSISLVSQIYNIPGDLGSFLLTWSVLCLPLVYLMRSSVTSLLYIITITYYLTETGYWSSNDSGTYIYWILLVAVLPYYYGLLKARPNSNFIAFHNWVLPGSVIISLGSIAQREEELMFVSYMSLFGLLYAIGRKKEFGEGNLWTNGFRVLGSFGIVTLLMIVSFKWFWEEVYSKKYDMTLFISPEFLSVLVLGILMLAVTTSNYRGKSLNQLSPMDWVGPAFMALYFLGYASPVSLILVNLLIFILGILMIREGARADHLGILNYGLLIITILIVCRFFDSNLSFALRGVTFVLVGAGFFGTNYWILKKRKNEPK